MNVLSIAVHPDDETLGCGGALLKHAAAGDRLHWLLLTSAQQPEFGDAAIAQQQEQVGAVERAYPFSSLDWLRLPTTRLETVRRNELVSAIRSVIERLRPEVIYVPNRSDAHSDHQVAFQAIAAVLKGFNMKPLGVRRILACEVLSETDAALSSPGDVFLPNVFVEISAEIARKVEIMKLYRSEIQADPLPRSASAILALARQRGATVGVEYAEAFSLLREIA